ncbi:MAG: hypothetical protein JWQ74_3613 [Marmoricola sp.]|nr:hypothetical protein [Marmoricola sp.]
MSLLSWFTRKRPTPRTTAPDTSGFSVPAGERAVNAGGRTDAVNVKTDAKLLKNERMERREWLYSVVREAMLHAGVLTASFKFKVLALDERGRQFLVMVDLAPALGGDTARLSKIESQIIQTAKARYDLVITAVYWRTNDHVAVGLPRATAPAAPVFAAEPAKSNVPEPAPEPVLGTPSKPGRFEPIQADEVAAFKRALAQAAGQPAAPGAVLRSGPRSKPSPSGYEDTEMQPPENRPDALSATQYGDLR